MAIVMTGILIRVLRLRESLKILNQALKDIPGGPIMDQNSNYAPSA